MQRSAKEATLENINQQLLDRINQLTNSLNNAEEKSAYWERVAQKVTEINRSTNASMVSVVPPSPLQPQHPLHSTQGGLHMSISGSSDMNSIV